MAVDNRTRVRLNYYESPGTPCPYLAGRTWKSHFFFQDSFPDELYEQLIDHGYRRSGRQFYYNVCPGCTACLPLRVPLVRFQPSKSQRRIWRRNADVVVRAEPAAFDPECYEVYRRYCASRHERENAGQDDFRSFLCESPLTTLMMKYRLGGRLAGIGWVDVLPASLSSTYFAFDPEFGRRSLGTFSVMKEIEMAAALGKHWLQLGFWVEGSRKMDYKACFRPHEVLVEGGWMSASGGAISFPES